MLLSDFWPLMDQVFGVAYARTLAREMALTPLDSMTADAALEAGINPRDVWHALCEAMDVPEHQRDGGDRERMIPAARRAH